METAELKANLHKIVDNIKDEQLLRTVYDFLNQNKKSSQSKLWNSLTEEQKSELYLSYQESETDSKLNSWETVKNKY